MSTLLIANARATSPPVDGDAVRSTVTHVDAVEPPAVEPTRPDYNAALADQSSEGGLTTAQLASYVLPSQKYRPTIGDANDWADNVQSRVNDQISTSGTAAAREAAGEQGHGTFKVVEGIEPTIVDGQQFGGDYFVTNGRSSTGGDYMTPTSPTDLAVQSTGNDASRDAVQASRGYLQSWLSAATGIDGAA